MKLIIIILALAASAAWSQGISVFPSSGGGGVGAANVTATAAGPVTSVDINVTSLGLTSGTLKTTLTQCWSGTGPYSPLVITGLAKSTSTFTPTFTSSSNVICVVNSNGGAGATGAAGNTVRYGTAAPTSEGNNGDFYIRTTTNYIYGPKATGSWPSGTSLVGAQGPAGTLTNNSGVTLGNGTDPSWIQFLEGAVGATSGTGVVGTIASPYTQGLYFDSTTHLPIYKYSSTFHTLMATDTAVQASQLTASVMPVVPLPTPSAAFTISLPNGYGKCTTTCTVTVPAPTAAGQQFCVWNGVGVSTAITLSAIASVYYSKTDLSAYGTVNTAATATAAAGNKICMVAPDTTHWDVLSYAGSWTMN